MIETGLTLKIDDKIRRKGPVQW